MLKLAGSKGARGSGRGREWGWRGESDGESKPCATWMAARNGTGGEIEGGRERCSCLPLLEFVAPPNRSPGLGSTICTKQNIYTPSRPARHIVYVGRGLTQCSGLPRMEGGVLGVDMVISRTARSSSPFISLARSGHVCVVRLRSASWETLSCRLPGISPLSSLPAATLWWSVERRKLGKRQHFPSSRQLDGRGNPLRHAALNAWPRQGSYSINLTILLRLRDAQQGRGTCHGPQ
ncbi:hypothetical protein C8Q78DRAFT_624685 [Trametes maxima]|nr:hypothetical protein C8Q78DRAFT_624685 [Trametes maxima]